MTDEMKPATTSDQLAQALMEEFAVATGVTEETSPRRYLWTDAFAVCNFLALSRRTGEARYLDLAAILVRQVHQVLGRHRPDDSRIGWISGLSEEAGKNHPTQGGLRIGKPLNERNLGEPSNSRLEWEQDGQYFHYLTKWMHALSRMSRETGERCYWQWAAELAETAQRTFTLKSDAGPKRLAWKMSIDLSRPLISATGQHDALDGLVTCLELQFAGSPNAENLKDLKPSISNLFAMCAYGRWATDDALGIGGLLDAATRLAAMVHQGHLVHRDLLFRVLIEAARSLQAFDESSLHRPANHRLAFRELGLAIGLSGIEQMGDLDMHDGELSEIITFVSSFRAWGEQIRDFWQDEIHRNNQTWHDHRDINAVMLATSLLPEGFLSL